MKVGDLVLERIPGLDGNLDEAWRGPWKVLEKLGDVTYRLVKVDSARQQRVVHVNVLKRYIDKVRRISVLIEEEYIGSLRAEMDPVLAEVSGRGVRKSVA